MQIRVTLSDEQAAQVRARVISGEYASEGDVLREGLALLEDRDRSVEDWLRTEVVGAYDAHLADPSRSLSGEQIRASLAARHGEASRR